jgi:hypothetical protein
MSKVISGFRVKFGTTEDDVQVASGGKLTEIGIIKGTLTVESGGYAHIIGMVRELVVEPGGRAKLRGICTEDVTNNGGDLTISGAVWGELHGRSVTKVLPSAKIGEKPI